MTSQGSSRGVEVDDVVGSNGRSGSVQGAHAEEPPGGGLPRDLSRVARALGAALTPPTAVVALAVYFAVRRQEALALHFGIDTSVLAYSTQDYLLRAGDTLFVALLFLLLAAWGALRFHAAILRRGKSPRAAVNLRRLAIALVAVGGTVLALGVFAVFWRIPVPIYGRTLSLGVGAALLAYGMHVRDRLASSGSLEPAWISAAGVALVACLMFLSAFWTTKELAQALGRGQAEVLERSLAARPGVIILSDRPLFLSGPGIRDQRVNDGGSLSYQYSGLRLLVRSGDQYFLLPEGWSRESGSAIVLPKSDTIRIELVPGGR